MPEFLFVIGGKLLLTRYRMLPQSLVPIRHSVDVLVEHQLITFVKWETPSDGEGLLRPRIANGCEDRPPKSVPQRAKQQQCADDPVLAHPVQ